MTGSVLAVRTRHFKLKSDGAKSDTKNRKSLHLPAIQPLPAHTTMKPSEV